MPGGILAHSHVSGVTNPSCPCSHDAAGQERLWIISALSPGGDLTLKLQVSVLHKESVKPSSGWRSCSENLAVSVTLQLSGPLRWQTDRQTDRGECSTKSVPVVLSLLLATFTLGFNPGASIHPCKRQTPATAVKLVLCGAQHCSTRIWKILPNSSSFRQNYSLFQNIS